MFLGIEIGGTKLQLAIGQGDGSKFAELVRLDVEPQQGAKGILAQIEKSGAALVERYKPQRAGIGFGGPVDAAAGRVIKSHQIDGWENVALTDWIESKLKLPAILGNDCDCAALAEARFGAGQGSRTAFFVTVGTGVGGGLVIDGELHGAGRPAVAEIGHLRPGLDAATAHNTVESLASGPGIARTARQLLAGCASKNNPFAAQLAQQVDGDLSKLTAKLIGQAAAEGNEIALAALAQGVQALGWAIAQTITLLAPETIVVGGGVSLLGEELFFAPLRQQVARYVFPPLAGSYSIEPAALGELVVVHGALALAAGATQQ